MSEKTDNRPHSWVFNERIFERHQTSKQDWFTSCIQAKRLMDLPYQMYISFNGNSGAPIETNITRGIVNIQPWLFSVQTSINYRNIVLAHEIGHLYESLFKSGFEPLFNLLPAIGRRNERLEEIRVNKTVYKRLVRLVQERQAKTMFRKTAEEQIIIDYGKIDEAKVSLFMQKHMPFIS
jgi:hypothetical protein